ncbi:MAG: enoyl-CoA hydratase/isomerase family protein [Chloroflexia bacterium]|nr:enoyl-CoA hydratase/isomerase family protein [Chloroflexia bacterium]
MAINLDYQNRIAIITVNQHDKLNALDSERLQSLFLRIQEATLNPAVRVIVLTGAGERAFVAGADIKEMGSLNADEGRALGELGHAVASALESAPQPVIAAVNGYAFGGGCELALACDIRLASENAVFAQPEVSLGIPPGWGGSQRLPRIVGPGIASELIYTGRRVAAEEALRIGLVNAVHEPDELMEKALDMARLIAANSPRSVREAKRLIALTRGATWRDGLAAEATTFGAAFGTPDQIEGMTAFVEKRKPAFSDEPQP